MIIGGETAGSAEAIKLKLGLFNSLKERRDDRMLALDPCIKEWIPAFAGMTTLCRNDNVV
jgi:hypothetical protein